MAEQDGNRFVTYKFLITWGLSLVGIFLGFTYVMTARYDKAIEKKADIATTTALCDDIEKIKVQSMKNGENMEDVKIAMGKMEILLRQLTAVHSTIREREDPYNPLYREKKK